MLRSMTGFGLAQTETDQYIITVEVKSLNSKFLEASVKLPRDYSDKELEVRNQLTNQLERGKVSCSIDRQAKGGTRPKLAINLPLFKAYYHDLMAAASEVEASTTDLFRLAMQMPDVTTSEAGPTQTSEEEWQAVQQAVTLAIQKCNQFRDDEGAALARKLEEHINTIETLLTEVEASDPQRIASTRQRLHDKLQDLALNLPIDNNRFEQEMIYYLEKLDITEEKVRLRQHLQYFLQEMNSVGAGKKLGFISQEIGREINTIGSKVNEASIQRHVVNMKDELEKIKEQSLNVL